MGQVISEFVHGRLSKQLAFALALCTLGAGVFLIVRPVFAADFIGEAFIFAFGRLVQWMVGILGTLLINLFYILIAVAQYNSFLGAHAVTAGWLVVRDLVNMFFVLVLLAIAIGTILQQQQYHYSQTLPKFLIAAILVNFSKTICGVFIDFAQVVMMTFVGAISGAIGGNLAALIGIPTLLQQVNPVRTEVGGTSMDAIAFGGFVLALLFVCIALIVVGIMVVMLVIRIVALWFLIILSPTVFFFMALPSDRGYGAKWWDQFINYLLVGPVTMFFLWLSLIVVQTSGGDPKNATTIHVSRELNIDFANVGNGGAAITIGDKLGGTGISTIEGLSGYILGICMLMATLMAAQQLSSVGGNIAGAGAGYVKDWLAGKRGPLNPMRAARETIGGVMARREERRKERVQKRVERFDRALGIAQSLPAEGAKAVGKGLLQTKAGKAVRKWYDKDSTQTGLDTVTRFATGFTGGWGRIHQARREEKRSRLEKDNVEKEEKIGDSRAKAEQADRDADMHMKQAMAARKDGNTPVEMAHREAAEKARNVAATHKGVAEGLENEVQWNKGQLALQKAGEIAFSGIKQSAKFLVAGALAPVGGALLYAPGTINNVGKRGKEHARLAEEAQANDVAARAGKLKDRSKDELNVLYASATTDRDKMAINQAMIEGGHADEHEVESILQQQKGLGADTPTMNQMNRAAAKKYPLRNWGLDPRFLKDPDVRRDEVERKVIPKMRSGELSAENMTADSLRENREQTEAVLEVLSGPNFKKEQETWTKQLQNKSGSDGEDARAAVADIAAEMASRERNADGSFTIKGRELLQIFYKAGGQMHNMFASLNEEAGEFQGPDAARDQKGFDSIAEDPNLKKFVPLSLSKDYYDGLGKNPANYKKPMTQSIIKNTDGKMIRTMRGEATGIKGEEDGLEHVNKFYDAVANYEQHVGAPLRTAEEAHQAAQETHQAAQTKVVNIDNEINTVVNNTKAARDGLAAATRKQYKLNATSGIAPESLMNAEEEVKRFNREIKKLDAQEKALRAQRPTAVTEEANTATQERGADVVRKIEKAERDILFASISQEIVDTIKSVSKLIQQGILHQAAGVHTAQQQATPPPPPTP